MPSHPASDRADVAGDAAIDPATDAAMLMPAELGDEPPSVKVIYLAIVAEGPIRYTELQQTTRLSGGTLSAGVARLTEMGLVETRPLATDARVVRYEAIDTPQESTNST
jgi:DNA-binding transcriptional regulator GbsR (MarR family)